MATKAPSKRGRQKGEQPHLPEMAPAKDKDIHPVALKYVRARDTRMEYGKEEVELKTRLIALMEKKGITTYTFEDIDVTMTAEKKVKVKKGGRNAEDE